METVWKVEWKVAVQHSKPLRRLLNTNHFVVDVAVFFICPKVAETFKLQLIAEAARIGSVGLPTITPIGVVGEVSK